MRTQKTTGPAPWLCLFGIILWTWFFWGIVIVTGNNLFAFPTAILAILGFLGPLVIPAILISAGNWDPKLDTSAKDFLIRSFHFRTLSVKWYLIVVGLILLLTIVPLLFEPAVVQNGLIQAGPAFFLLIGAVAGFVEEPGWRGYAQEGLQRQMSVITASVVIGLFWALWHLPLFFISGTYQAELGFGTRGFLFFTIAILVGSPIYAWLYNATDRVIFAPVLFHGLGNVMSELVPDASAVTELGLAAVLTLAITLISWRWMFQRRPGG